jgi:hypothetical protein
MTLWDADMRRAIAFLFFPLAGCVYAPVPELPTFPAVEYVEPKTEAKIVNPNIAEAIKHPQPRDSPVSKADGAPQCQSLPMPEPIPKTLFIDIGNGNDKADENGVRLLNSYKELRKEIKKKWHAKPP